VRFLSQMCIRVLALLAGALLLSAGAWGQASTAALYGEVLDQQGAAVTGAKVTLTNTATGATRSAETDETGRYQFLAVLPGKYSLKVEKDGFRTAVRENLDLLVNTISKLNIPLEIGQVTETIVIEEAAAPLNTTDSSIGNVITSQQVLGLPLEARSIVQLLSLQPGAVFVPTGDMRSGAISGARSDQSNITLDGVDINDPQSQTGGYDVPLRVTAESLQEFRVTTSNYGADTGRSSGGQVALVTRSGSNEFHGSAYWVHRNTATSSNEYFNKLGQLQGGRENKPPKLMKHNYGASGSGPIWKDRIFLFGNFESLRQLYEAAGAAGSRSVPSETFRDGILIYQCRDLAGHPNCPTSPTTVTGLSGRTYSVPAGFFGASPAQLAAIDPLGIGPSIAASNYWRQFPLPNLPGRDCRRDANGNLFGNICEFLFTAPLADFFYTYIAKIDVKFDRAGNHSLYLRGTLLDDFQDGVPQFPGQPPSTSTLRNPKGVALGYTAVINPRLINTARYGYTFFKQQTAGQQTFSPSLFRFMSSFEAFTATSVRSFYVHNFVDDVSWTKGAHTVQFGTNIRVNRLPRSTNANSFHFAIANGSWLTGVGRVFLPGRSTCTAGSGPPGCDDVPAVATGAVAIWADSSINIWGILSQGTARYNYTRTGASLPEGAPVTRRYANNEWEFYLQDSWRIWSNFTLNFGARYSLFSPPWEVNGNQVAPVPSFHEFFESRRIGMLNGVPSNRHRRISFDLAGPANGRPGTGFYDYDLSNIAPHVSFAWSPRFSSGILGALTGNGKMVIRGGYRIVYDRIGQALATTFDSAGSFGMSTSLTTPFGSLSESTAPRFVAVNVLPGAPLILPAPPGGFPSTPAFGLFAITTSIDDSVTTPYAHSFNLAIGRELPGNFAVEFAYVGRKGRSLLTKQDLAMPLDLVDPASGQSYFQAASALAALAERDDPIDFTNPTPTSQVPRIPFWENIYPGMAGNPICDIDGLGSTATATQAVYDLFLCVAPDYTTALQFLDQDGLCTASGSCSRFGPFAFFQDQYASLAGQSTIGFSEYHALQVTARKRMGHGLQLDFNYTLSKSLDMTSDVERGSNFGSFFAGGYSEFIINPWSPRLNYAASTFDLRHQVNLNWIYQLPFGRGRYLGKDVPGWANHIIGGWDISGLFRWTSGFPFSVINCRSCWPTNWNLQGNASLKPGIAPPATRVVKNAIAGLPSAFVDRDDALTRFRRSRPGEAGLRNNFRGDGYFTIDTGVAKTWTIYENFRFMLRWEVFNLTNTPRFDVGSLSATPDLTASFGRYNGTLAICDGAAGRCMQFALRLEF